MATAGSLYNLLADGPSRLAQFTLPNLKPNGEQGTQPGLASVALSAFSFRSYWENATVRSEPSPKPSPKRTARDTFLKAIAAAYKRRFYAYLKKTLVQSNNDETEIGRVIAGGLGICDKRGRKWDNWELPGWDTLFSAFTILALPGSNLASAVDWKLLEYPKPLDSFFEGIARASRLCSLKPTERGDRDRDTNTDRPSVGLLLLLLVRNVRPLVDAVKEQYPEAYCREIQALLNQHIDELQIVDDHAAFAFPQIIKQTAAWQAALLKMLHESGDFSSNLKDWIEEALFEDEEDEDE